MKLWYLSHIRPAKAQASLRICVARAFAVRKHSVEEEERSDKNSDI